MTRLALMAKLKAGRLGREVTDSLPAVLGRHGLHERDTGQPGLRDSRLTSIGGGADEVMLQVICKLMGTLPGMKK